MTDKSMIAQIELNRYKMSLAGRVYRYVKGIYRGFPGFCSPKNSEGTMKTTMADKMKPPPSEETLREACRVYSLLNEITDNGCDVEVKKIKGKLKIIKVQKQIATEIEIRS